MERYQLEHIIRAASGITGATDFIVVGSQAILGQFPEAPVELRVSIEVDLFTLRDPSDAELVEGCIGEGSPFHQTFGYYAHGVGMETAVLPEGWQDRLVPVCNENTGAGRGLCLEVHDLAASKLVAGREKDLAYVGSLVRHGMATPGPIGSRLALMPITPEARQLAETRLNRLPRSP